MKELLRKIGNFIRTIVSDIYEIAEEKAPLAVLATQKVKDFIEKNQVGLEALVKKTESTKDDEALDAILKYLPVVSKKILVADGFISENESELIAAEKLLILLRDTHKEGRIKYWIVLAAEMLLAILGRKLPLNVLVMATQAAFAKLFTK
jgi:tRNA U55 pseudouridine synthase TruB